MLEVNRTSCLLLYTHWFTKLVLAILFPVAWYRKSITVLNNRLYLLVFFRRVHAFLLNFSQGGSPDILTIHWCLIVKLRNIHDIINRKRVSKGNSLDKEKPKSPRPFQKINKLRSTESRHNGWYQQAHHNHCPSAVYHLWFVVSRDIFARSARLCDGTVVQPTIFVSRPCVTFHCWKSVSFLHKTY